MRMIAYSLCTVLLLNLPALGNDLIWETDLEAVLAEAAEQDRQVLVDFEADWCHPCQLMHETTLADPTLRRSLQAFLRVKVDFDRHPQLAARYSINTLPAYLVLAPDGQVMGRITGYRDSEVFGNWLREPRHAPTAVAPTAAGAAWQELSVEEQIVMIPELMERVIADKTGTATRAEEDALGTFAKTDPQPFLKALNDPRLAMRILAGNLLQANMKQSVRYDPWAAYEERQGGIAELRGLLLEGQEVAP